MTDDELEVNEALEEKPDNEQPEESVPIGIARIRQEWRAAGLREQAEEKKGPRIEPVLFPEIDGGAGIGDYVLDLATVRDRLALSQEAMERLIDSGEIDSILVQGPDGQPRRLISQSSVDRFQEDSQIDPDAVKRAAKAMADRSIVESIEELSARIDELRNSQSKITQQMKDVLLLEIRNLKEQDRDLTSFVYELAEEIKKLMERRR